VRRHADPRIPSGVGHADPRIPSGVGRRGPQRAAQGWQRQRPSEKWRTKFRTLESGGLPGPCRRPLAVRHGLNLSARPLTGCACVVGYDRIDAGVAPQVGVRAAHISATKPLQSRPFAVTAMLRNRRRLGPAGACLTIYEVRSAAPHSPHGAVPCETLSRTRPRPPHAPLAASTGRPLCLVVALAAPPPPGAVDDAPLRPPRPPPRTRRSPCHLGRPQRPALGCVARHQLPPRPIRWRQLGDATSTAGQRAAVPLVRRHAAGAAQRNIASHLAGAVLVARKSSAET
jgi:hypothetical protein